MQLSKYTVAIKFQPDRRSIALMERQLKQLEKNLAVMQKRMQLNFSKSFVLPALKVKKFEFDSLSLQRNAQTALTRVGRLLELKVSNFHFDQSKINAQVQNVFQRAANNARINVKTIAGTGGGGQPYRVPHFQPPSGTGFGAGFGGGFGGSMIPRLGPGMMGAAGVVGAGLYGAQKVGQAQDTAAKTQTQLLKLRTSGTTIAGKPIEDALLELSNEIGVSAEGSVDSFSRFLKQTKNSGMTSDQGFKLFKDMSVATRGNGGDQQSIDRQAYALQQIMGVGYLRSEELNQQLADSNPAIKSFIQKAYEERTGNQGTESFQKAMSKREVSVEDVLRGYELSAKDAAGAVAAMANSIDGERARLENSKFSEELDRVGGEMTEATQAYVKSQAELHEATKPLRDSFYKIAAAGTGLAARLLSFTAKELEKAPALKGTASPEQSSSDPLASSTGRGLLSVPDITKLNEERTLPKQITPLKYEKPQWMNDANKLSGLDSILADLRSSKAQITNTTTIAAGAFTINTQATDGDTLAAELEPHIKNIFRTETTSMLKGVMLESPESE